MIPVQAKSGSDQLGAVQTKQDILCCREKFPKLICRAVSSQFMADDVIAMFELPLEDEAVKIVDERHYRLVPSDAVTSVRYCPFMTSESSSFQGFVTSSTFRMARFPKMRSMISRSSF